ncbi:MAG TPA: CPBP family intramembrane metalloprotease, partial [Leptolyngbyaceae cyanobacterium M65_K2018_010]|nr:CPBP family intramembrane metalloprotease [Leptolyngbyaceae cyanobacterium M65_K2018_010]
LNPEALANPNLGAIALTGALAALAVGWSEEVLFRGWLLQELEQGYSPAMALSLSSLVFALAHFIKPLEAILRMLPQFFGLLLLGMTLVWARRISLPPVPRATSLGPAVGLHSGLVWAYYVLNVGELMRSTHQVPAWVTGLEGNPLAGLLGIGLLTGLAGLCFRWAHAPVKDAPPGSPAP